MIDYLSEIPLPGRMLSPPAKRTPAHDSHGASLGFIAGAENRLVANAVNRLIGTPTSRAKKSVPTTLALKLLVLFGPSGTGKTHLAHGMVRHWHEQRGPDSALYLTASDFYRQLIEAIKRNTIVDFRRSIRDRELLAIDDLNQLPDNAYVSQELRATLDSYDENDATIIVTADRIAITLANISADIRSRLASGLMLQLVSPGKAARTRIVRRASEALGQPVSEDSATRLAAGVPGNANDLFGAIFELCATTGHRQANATQAEHLIAARHARRPSMPEIISAVSRYFDVPRTHFKSQSRRQSIVTARAVAIYLARESAGTSYEQIGRALGGRDHTTIMHNYRKIERLRARDPAIQEAIEKLTSTLQTR